MWKWIIGLLVSSPIWFGVALFAASEYGGETVELQTVDDRGTLVITKLWVVDLHEQPWLRAGDPKANWLQRAEVNPDVFLIRNGQSKAFRAVVSDEGAGRVNEAMQAKYGLADRLVALIHDPDAVVAIRLVAPSSFDP